MKITLLGTGTPAPSLDAAELGLSLRGRRRPARDGPRPRRPPSAHRERASRRRRQPRVLQPPALRPLHGLRASRAPALGHGRGPDPRPRGVRTDTDRAHDRAALRRGRRLRTRHPRAHRAPEQHRRLRGARRDAAAQAARAARDGRCTRATSSRATAGRSPSATRRTCSRSSSASRSVSTATSGSVCYSGDSGACEELVELARGCDVLIHMNHHFSGTEPTASYRAACGNHRDNAAIASARRREDAGADARPRADRSARRPRADRPRDPAGVRRPGDLGRGSDAAHARGRRRRGDRESEDGFVLHRRNRVGDRTRTSLTPDLRRGETIGSLADYLDGCACRARPT